MLSRRGFLKAGTLSALSMSLAASSGSLVFGQRPKQAKPSPSVDFPIPESAKKDPLFYYTKAAFDPCVGSVFTTPGASGPVELTLISVTGYKTNPKTRITTSAARRSESFSLSFRASGPLAKFEPIHTLNHPVLGKIDLFLTERKTDDGIFYEAVINHAL